MQLKMKLIDFSHEWYPFIWNVATCMSHIIEKIERARDNDNFLDYTQKCVWWTQQYLPIHSHILLERDKLEGSRKNISFLFWKFMAYGVAHNKCYLRGLIR